MPTKDLVQVVSYVSPTIKKLAQEKIEGNKVPMTMSAYIGMLLRRDLERRRA